MIVGNETLASAVDTLAVVRETRGLTNVVVAGACIVLAALVLMTLFWDQDRAQKDVAPARLQRLAADGTTRMDVTHEEHVALSPRPLELPDPDDGTAAPDAEFPGRAVFTGRVVDVAGAPVAGARVLCIPDSWTLAALGYGLDAGFERLWVPTSSIGFEHQVPLDVLPSSTTDEDGRFRLECAVAARGEHDESTNAHPLRPSPELLITHDAHVAARRECPDFRVGSFDAGTIQLESGAALVGRVVDERGRPIEGVDVKADSQRHLMHVSGGNARWRGLDPGKRFSWTTSAEDGRFRLTGLWPGSLRLSAQAAGRLPASLAGVELAAGETTDVGDLVLSRGGIVSGRVVDATGASIEGAEIRASVHHFEKTDAWPDPVHAELNVVRYGALVHTGSMKGIEEGRYAVTSTDADGRFELGGLTDDEYGIYVEATGFEPDAVQRVETGSTDLWFRLERQGRLTVHIVRESDGEPILDATLRVVRGSGPKGDYFPRGGADLSVIPTDGQPDSFLVEGVCGAALAAVVTSPTLGRQALPLSGLELGAAPQERVLSVPAPAGIEGSVIDGSGRVLQGMKLTLRSRDGSAGMGLFEERVERTGADGRFVIDGLEAGAWTLGASGSGFVFESKQIVSKAGDTTVAVFTMVRTGRLEGTVVDASGRVVTDCRVTLKEAGSPDNSARGYGTGATDADGHYAVDAEPGSYRVEFHVKGSATRRGVASTVLMEGDIQRLDFSLPPETRVMGRVTAAGAPVPDAIVHLKSGRLRLKATTDESGEYLFEVSIAIEGHLFARSPAGGLSVKVPLHVTPGQSLVVDIELGDAELRGVVVEEGTGVPIAGAEVRMSVKGGAELYPPVVETRADGTFVIGHVAQGTWRLVVYHDLHLKTPWIKLKVPPDRPIVETRIEMVRGGTLSGTVRTMSGALTVQKLDVQVWKDDEQYWTTHEEHLLDGGFRFVNLESATYEILVMRRLGNFERTDRDKGRSLARVSATISVEAGQDIEMDLYLPAGER